MENRGENSFLKEYAVKIKPILYSLVLLTLLEFCLGDALGQETTYPTGPERVFYVAINGNDQWSGTLPEPTLSRTDGPFASLHQARNAIRKLKQSGSNGSFTVLVRGGVYELDKTLALGPEDSGTESHSLVFKAFKGERPILSGAKKVRNFAPYKGLIQKADLSEIVDDFYPVRQLFVDSKRQTLARYPNFDPLNPIGGGYLYVDSPGKKGNKREFRYAPGSVHEWTGGQDAEVVIFPGNDWKNNTITISGIDRNTRTITLSRETSYEIKPGNRYFFQNLPDELDSPGEWYFDRKGKTLYFWPVNTDSLRAVSVPVLKTIIEIKDKMFYKRKAVPAQIRIEGFTLEGCTGSAIVVNGAKDVIIASNTVYNAGGHGIEIQNGLQNAVVGNDVYEVGVEGIHISGGDRKTLTPGGNKAENNYVHHIGVFQKAASGIFCGGVGNTISHNRIHTTPRMAIYLDGNDNVVEYNHAYDVNQETRDSGVIYCSGVDWTKRGNIIQFNYFHNSGGYGRNVDTKAWQTPFDTYGIYLDDWLSGTTVYGNVVVNTASSGIYVHSGRDNIIENNIIIEGGSGQMAYTAWPPDSPTSQKWLPEMFAKTKEKQYSKYPLLLTIKDIETGSRMAGNSFVRNVIYYSGKNALLYRIYNDIDLSTTVSDYNTIFHAQLPLLIPFTKVSDNRQWTTWQSMGLDQHSLIGDPLFVNIEASDFTLSPASPALRLGFKPIPFEKIGPYQDCLRASWPLR